MARILDNIIALRIIYLLVQPIVQTDAFKLGLIDANGNNLKKAETPAEKNATSMLHRLVWNLKKVINLAPGGNTRIGSLAAAYLLVKESVETNKTIDESTQFFTQNFDRFFGLEFEGKGLVEDALSALLEDAPANATGTAVSTNTPTINPGVMKRKGRFAEVTVKNEVFDRFSEETKIRKLSSFLNVEDATEKQIFDFIKKTPKAVLVLKDGRGKRKAIRYSKRGTDNWANLKSKDIVESILYDSIQAIEIVV